MASGGVRSRAHQPEWRGPVADTHRKQADFGPGCYAPRMSDPITLRRVAARPAADERQGLAPLWDVLVWNDPVNLMSYVIFVFQRVFGYNRALAQKLMLEVHHQGKSLVATEPREQAEHHLAQLHGYGLQATLQRHT